MEFKDWTRFHGTFVADPTKKVRSVEFQIEAKDAVSSTNGIDRVPIHITDVQFQAGEQLTGWVPNTAEMLSRLKWRHDEWKEVPTNSVFMGAPPRVIEEVDKRWYNFVGRGHKTFVASNYLPEDWDVEVLPTGLEIEIIPKNDFDLLRVSSAIGVEVPEEERWYFNHHMYKEIKEKYEEVTSEGWSGDKDRKDQEVSNWENIISVLFENHPIHKRYTREFWVEGGKAGEPIIIDATRHTATQNGVTLPLVGVKEITLDSGSKFPIERRKFMGAPRGTSTIRIEFYVQREREITTYDMTEDGEEVRVKKTFKYLEDAGIGYHGTIGFIQWTYGRARI